MLEDLTVCNEFCIICYCFCWRENWRHWRCKLFFYNVFFFFDGLCHWCVCDSSVDLTSSREIRLNTSDCRIPRIFDWEGKTTNKNIPKTSCTSWKWMEKQFPRPQWLNMKLVQVIENEILEISSLICPLYIDFNAHAKWETTFERKISDQML